MESEELLRIRELAKAKQETELQEDDPIVDPGKGDFFRLDYPPNILSIAAVLPLKGKEIFAYDGVIYNPDNIYISEELLSHEIVHLYRQAQHPTGAEGWWLQYLSDEQFRFEEELYAHANEYRTFCKGVKDRNARARFLNRVAMRLASPMYGLKITHGTARKAILITV